MSTVIKIIKKQVINNGSFMGDLGLLWVIFIALKVMEIITWPWLVVIFFPILAGLGILLGVACIFGVGVLLTAAYLEFTDK